MLRGAFFLEKLSERQVPQQEENEPGRSVLAKQLPQLFSTLLLIGVAFFLGLVWSYDWMLVDRWWCTWISVSIFWLVAFNCSTFHVIAYSVVFGVTAISQSFWWAEDMLAYSLNQEGRLPGIIFWILVGFETVPFLVFGFLIARIRRKHPSHCGFLIPSAFWISAELFWPRIFPWTLGHSQLGWLEIVQCMDLAGASTASIAVLCVTSLPALAWDAWNSRFEGRAILAMRLIGINSIVLLIALGYGVIRGRDIESTESNYRTLTIGAIQQDPSFNESISKLREQSRGIREDCDLFVWPESTLGTHSAELKSFSDEDFVRLKSEQPFVDATPILDFTKPLIVGGRVFESLDESTTAYYQSAFLIYPRGDVRQLYHKRSLMPIGEYVPFESSFPWLHDWFQLDSYMRPGESPAPMVLEDGSRIGLLVCYEDIIHWVSRSAVQAGSQVLVSIINASAFRHEVALRQHMRLSQVRCIENRRWMARVAGTGISCAITPTGRIAQQLRPDVPGEMVVRATLRDNATLFLSLGNWLNVIALVLVLAYLMSEARSAFLRLRATS
jgi:apolipoprotein N-acyltransferase